MPDRSPESWHQLWATFSVRDHCRPGAFVADVLLYDKLLIPVMPTVKDGLSVEQAELEHRRWSQEGWHPEVQSLLLDILGDTAERIVWGRQLQDDWQKAMNEQIATARRNGYFMTGRALERFAPAMAKTVVAVSPVYNVEQLARAGIRRRVPEDPLPGGSLLAVLGHELLLPDDPGRDHLDVLRKAVAVARDNEYRNRRRDLYLWQQKFLTAGGLTDAPSIREALKEMTTLVDRVKTATRSQKSWKWVKRFFTFMGVAAKGAAVVGPAMTIVAGGAGAVASLGTFVVDEASPKRDMQELGVPAATLILDAREKLDIE